MATITLRPTSATGTSWQNTNRVYDGDTSQAATVSINSSNYSQRTLTVDFSTSSIPQNAQITKATLTVIAKQSSSTSTRRITVQADINGSSSSRVIDQQLTSTSNTTLTADVANYMGNLSSLTITGVTSASSYQSQTFSIYEIYVDVEYQEANVTLTNLTLNTTNEEMEIDDTITLRCTLTPSTANSYDITWSSNNNNVQLTKNGTNCTVKALTSGTSTVTVTDTITGLSATCTIRIKNPYEDVGQQIEIYLPQPLGNGDKLYWDNANSRYFIQHSTGIIQTEIIQKIEFDTPKPYVKIVTDEAEVAPSSISVELAMKEITDDGGDSGGGTEQEGDWVEADMRPGTWISIHEFSSEDYEYGGLYQHNSEVIYLDGLKEIHVQGENYDQVTGIGVVLFGPSGESTGIVTIDQVSSSGPNAINISELYENAQIHTGYTAIAIAFAVMAEKNTPTLRYKLIR